MKLLQDERSTIASRHAGLLTVLALATVAIGLLMGLGAVDLYESATKWVLLA